MKNTDKTVKRSAPPAAECSQHDLKIDKLANKLASGNALTAEELEWVSGGLELMDVSPW